MENTKKDKQERLIHYFVPTEDNYNVLSRIKCEYLQEADVCSPFNEPNKMIIETQPDGYFTIKTERWAIEDIDELIELLNDFKSRFSFMEEVKD